MPGLCVSEGVRDLLHRLGGREDQRRRGEREEREREQRLTEAMRHDQCTLLAMKRAQVFALAQPGCGRPQSRSTSRRRSAQSTLVSSKARRVNHTDTTYPPACLVRDHFVPLATDELSNAERGRREMSEDVREQLRWQRLNRSRAVTGQEKSVLGHS